MYVRKYGITTVSLYMFNIWDLMNDYNLFCGYGTFELSSSRKRAYL